MPAESKATRLAIFLQTTIDEAGYTGGERLGTKASLLKEHSIAAGTLNEALRLLQSWGCIGVKPGPRGGVFVAPGVGRAKMSMTLLAAQHAPGRLDDAFQVQDALQGVIASSAATHCTESDAERLLAALQELRSAQSAREILQASWEMDRQIALTSPNEFLRDIYCMVLDRIAELVQAWPNEQFGEDGARRIHERLALAVIRNSTDDALAAANEHSPTKYVRAEV